MESKVTEEETPTAKEEERPEPKLPTKNILGSSEPCCNCIYAQVVIDGVGQGGQTLGHVNCMRYPEVRRKCLNDWCGEHVDRELPQLEPGRIEEVREFRVGRKRAKKRSR